MTADQVVMPSLLDAVAFRDPGRARSHLEHVGPELRLLLEDHVERMLQLSPDPDGSFAYLASFVERHPDVFQRLTASTTGLKYLIATFSYSRFLSEEVQQNPGWIEDLVQASDMFRLRLPHEFEQSLEDFLLEHSGSPLARTLALFRRKQLLRIVLRDVLEFAPLPEITEEISNLAGSTLHIMYRRIRAELIGRYGRPLSSAPDGSVRETEFSVIALGKLGGCELNYSSDIDLMFVYSDNGATEGPVQISNKEFYKKLANQLTELLSTYTPEGICYRVDLRLRPEGRYGEVCISLEGAKQYYSSRARDWELQMLIKARVVAGEPGPGRELLDFVEPRIYSTSTDFSSIEVVSEARERISEKQASRRGGQGPSGFDIKLTRGGIRDIEFLVQCLQRLHGGRDPWVRHGGTMLALSRLHDKQLLSESEYARLVDAYQFLRELEHRLQFLDDRQTHSLPSDPLELDLLARRMPAAELRPDASAEVLRAKLNDLLEEVTEIYERVIHAQKPMYYTAAIQATDEEAAVEPQFIQQTAPSNLIRFLDQKAPGLAALIARRTTGRSARNLEHFLERALSNTEWMNLLDSDPLVSGCLLDLFDHSAYFAEQFIRFPELLEELPEVARALEAKRDYSALAADLQEPPDLRRFFRREMARLQCGSVCLRVPIFDTLAATSDLADSVIGAAYRIALAQVLATRPPRTPGYDVRDQLMVISLGRLGQREFDLASDADLLFVIPDADSCEQIFWTRVAERAIDLITAYTGEGVMFAVDTRLRPNGREGALVQTVTAFWEYFEKSAEAWEGIAYMKARGVAGDPAAATVFLNQLQDVDWRRWGQSGRSRRDLRAMRARLEKEQGGSNPLKAGRGGYYDIDFALMYLRLKSAGVFYKVLNTPERIDIIERMGHLDRDDAAFLRDAAVFYRSLDHALRIFSGHAEGSLPNSEAKLEALTELVTRWTPARLHHRPLKIELSHIQAQTREIFERLFA
jgi:[glutamine synthetase] adenylyltransferase / [glutamine synthetase]-adenylyl-L-tyrosine phosphorylase